MHQPLAELYQVCNVILTLYITRSVALPPVAMQMDLLSSEVWYHVSLGTQ